MNPYSEHLRAITRRHFFKNCGIGLGTVALASLINENLFAGESAAPPNPLAPKAPHFAAKAKRMIYLHMAGSPSQLDLFDYKPKLQELNGQPCPESLFKKERFAFIKGVPKMLGTPHKFERHGKSGAELSQLLPQLATVVDEIAVVKSIYPGQFQPGAAQLLLPPGPSRQGRPNMGGWLSFRPGVGSRQLPAFLVMVSGGKTPDG